MTISVRPAEPADAEAIGELRLASWRVAYGALIPAEAFAGFDAAGAVTRWRDRLAAGTMRGLVAEAGTQLVAFCTFGACRDDDLPGAAEVYGLYAAPERWSTGVGRQLFATAVAAIDTRPIVLWVLCDNARARRFYEIAGWTPYGAVKDADVLGGVLPEMRYRLG